MGSKNSNLQRTSIENLVSNLRGEIGEIVDSWILMREIFVTSQKIRTGDTRKDFSSPEYLKYLRIIEKFKNDIIARLSELSEKKVGQINFHFASQKLNTLITETKNYQDFIKEKKFVNLRHEYISHKKLPATWEEHKASYRISNLTILKGIAKALILMKGIDQVYLGIRSTFLWYEMRKKRYDFYMPFSGYTLLPYLRLPEKTRIYIARIEEEQGKEIWEDESIKKNNQLIRIKVYKELGLVKLGDQLIALPEYPINTIKNIEFQK